MEADKKITGMSLDDFELNYVASGVSISQEKASKSLVNSRIFEHDREQMTLVDTDLKNEI